MNNPVHTQSSLSQPKRKLLEAYLRGKLQHPSTGRTKIARRPAGEPARLSPAQEQVWMQEQILRGALPYNESITIATNRWLDAATLERSLAEIVRRHEIWRTSYDTLDGQLVQIIHPARCDFPLSVVDLCGASEPDRKAQLLKLTREVARQPFDLKNGPLLRVMLVKCTDTDQRLFLFGHLSILDGVSVYQILPAELAVLYESFSTGKPSPLPELPIQYADYAYWQRQWLKSGELDKQLAYWRGQLGEESPVLQWPSHSRKPAAPTYRGALQSFALSLSLTEALNTLSRISGVTLFAILLTSFSLLLYCYTGQLDFIVGTPSSGARKRSEVQGLLGYFLNPVALRINLQGNPSFHELLLRMQSVVADAVSYDDVPIEFLAGELRPHVNKGCNPFFSVALSLQPQRSAEHTGWHVSSMDADNGASIWDMYLAFIDCRDGLVGRVQYNPDVFDSEVITQTVQELQGLMEYFAVNAEQRIGTVRLSQLRRESQQAPVESLRGCKA